MSFLIATPMYGGQCTAGYFSSCLALKEALTGAGVAHDWLVTTNESLITRARDTSAARFLMTDYRKLLFLDADIEFAPEAVAKLWNLDADIAVAAYPMKRRDEPASAWVDGKLVVLDELEGITPVDYAGTGFMMIDRKVFEKLKDSLPQYEEGHVGNCVAYFQDPIEDGIHLSEDYFFCKRAREAGFDVLLDPTIRLTHWGSYGYGGDRR